MTSAETTADAAVGVESPAALRARVRSRRRLYRTIGLTLVWAFLIGNTIAIFYLWIHGGRISGDLSFDSTRQWVISLSRITGLLGAYLALIEVALLARLPWLERMVGFDKLTNWHRWNGSRLPLADPGAHVPQHLGLPAHRQRVRDRRRRHDVVLGRDGADHLGRRLPGDDRRDHRHRPALPRRVHVVRLRAQARLLRALVRDPHLRVRRDRARAGSTRSRPATT